MCKLKSGMVFHFVLQLLVFSGSCTAANVDRHPSGVSVFGEQSFWNQAIPRDTPLNPMSDRYVAEFQRQIKAYYGGVAINTSSYASPVFVAAEGQATVAVEQWDCQRKGYKDRELTRQWQAVPLPSYAQPSRGTDAELTVYQPATDTLWEFWRMRQVDGQWQACWGGRMQNVSRGSGIWHQSYGATATGLPFMGGQITAEELQHGEIKHVIGIALVDTERFDVVSWPAARSDGYNPSGASDRIPEGMRFRLDPALDLDTLKLHPVAKIIARAAQVYGFVVWDKAGAIGVRMQNPVSYTSLGEPDPYPALFSGTPAYAVLKGIPWDRLQFLPANYGQH